MLLEVNFCGMAEFTQHLVQTREHRRDLYLPQPRSWKALRLELLQYALIEQPVFSHCIGHASMCEFLWNDGIHAPPCAAVCMAQNNRVCLLCKSLPVVLGRGGKHKLNGMLQNMQRHPVSLALAH